MKSVIKYLLLRAPSNFIHIHLVYCSNSCYLARFLDHHLDHHTRQESPRLFAKLVLLINTKKALCAKVEEPTAEICSFLDHNRFNQKSKSSASSTPPKRSLARPTSTHPKEDVNCSFFSVKYWVYYFCHLYRAEKYID